MDEKNFYTKTQREWYKKEKKKYFKNFVNKYFKDKRLIKKTILKTLTYLKIIYREDNEKNYQLTYKSNSISREELEVLLSSNKKKILLPLAFQPELSTSLLGNEYDDQIRIIEKLVNSLGHDWIIIVKDHVMQTSYQRDQLFFERLKNFKNVYLIDKNFGAHKIIKNFDAVATTSGTAGWEAICLKKKCFLFGNSWYSNIEGVLKINDKLTKENIKEFLDKKFDEEKFNLNLVNLYNSFFDGYIVNEFFDYFDKNFDKNQNSQTCINSIKKYLNNENK